MGSVCTGARGWCCCAAGYIADTAIHFSAQGDVWMSPWWRREKRFWKTYERTPRVISTLAVPEEDGSGKAKHKGILTFTHKYIFICRMGGWWSWMETGNRKFAQEKCNSKARLACTKKTHYNWKDYFQISKPWPFPLFFKNLISKYKAMLIVASSGYCVYGALLPNTAVSVGPGEICNTSCSPFLSKIDFPVAFF